MCYLTNGIISSEKYQKYEIFLFLTLLLNDSILMLGLITAFFESTTAIYKTQIGAALCGIIYQFCFKVMAHTNKKHFLATTSKLLEDSKFQVTDILRKVHAKFKKKFLPFLLMAFTTFVVAFNVAFVRFFTEVEIDYNDANFYIVPFLFKFSPVNSFREYVGVMMLQLTFFSPEIIAYLSLVVYMCFVLASVEVHVEEINSYLKHLVFFAHNQTTTNSKNRLRIGRYRNSKEHDENEEIKIRFRELVRFQQYFYRLVSFYNYVISRHSVWIFTNIIAPWPRFVYFIWKLGVRLCFFTNVFSLWVTSTFCCLRSQIRH